MAIPQTNPKAGYLAQARQLEEAVGRVLASGQYLLGSELAAFEREFMEWIGVPHAVGVGSGTDALTICLLAAGVGPGDAVLTVSHTAVATVTAIERCGATPVLVEVDPERFTLDPSALEAALVEQSSVKPKAVIPVHLYGQPAEMRAIAAIARSHGLVVIEDCAQAAGAQLNDQAVGTFGDLAAFSFYPTKNLGAFGDGGMVVTSSPDYDALARRIREYGWDEQRVSQGVGINSRLDELQAAMLRVKLTTVDADNERRRCIAAEYSQSLGESGFCLPTVASEATHAFHQYVVRHERRDDFREHLEANGIGSGIHYATPVHKHPYFADRVVCASNLAVTEQLAARVLSLPMYPQLTKEDVQKVIAVCNAGKTSG